MKNIRILIALLIIGVITFIVFRKETTFINYSDSAITYQGRMDTLEGVNIYWSGSSVKLKFKGTNIRATLNDERGDNYFNVILDGDSIRILKLETGKQDYLLANQMEDTIHTIELFKRAEWDRGVTTFHGFKIKGDHKLFSTEKPKRKIEFYGNSITAGYAVDDLSGRDSPDSIFTNFYKSYAHLTANHFDAQFHATCKGGIGIMVSWFPLTMPEIYDRINPQDSISQWDFQDYQPEVLVLNLFQNDSWLVNKPDHESFRHYFGQEAPTETEIIEAYKTFVETLREKYPESHIICMLGNMDITREGSPWPSYVEQAVDQINDNKLYTHFVSYKSTPGHPNVSEQKVMAQSLIQFIESNINW